MANQSSVETSLSSSTAIISWCKNVGAVLRNLRIRNNLTQADLADLMNSDQNRQPKVQQGSISKVENGSGFRMEFILELCDCLDTSFANVIELAETLEVLKKEKQVETLHALKTTLHDRLMLPDNHRLGIAALAGAAQNVYRKMKELLSSGGHVAGHLFSTRDLMSMYRCRKSTAEKVFAQLLHEGYVQRISSDVVAKSGFDAEYLVSLISNRLTMEYEAGLHVATLNGNPTEELEVIHSQMVSRDCNIEQELSLFVDDDVRFHQTILALSGQAELIPTVETMTRHVIIGLGTHAHEARPAEILKEHKAIISAIQSGDKEQIFTAFRDHLAAGSNKWRSDVQQLLKVSMPGSASELRSHQVRSRPHNSRKHASRRHRTA